MKFINELTPEHKAAIPAWNEQTIKEILSLEPVDLPRFTDALLRCVEYAELPKPEVRLAPSPLEAWRMKCKAEGLDKLVPLDYSYWSGGREWLSWIRFVLFFRDVCGLELDGDAWDRGQAYYDMLREAGSCIIHTEPLVIVSEPPTRRETIMQGERLVLHCDGKPALEYSDGLKAWYLNGVQMPQWIVESAPQEVDVKKGLKLENAEQRREFIRKVGVERVYQVCGGKVLDKEGDYELVSLNLPDKRARPFLKMKNPSIGVYHIEGVPPHIKTVQQAINWRAGDEEVKWSPSVLT